MTVLEYLLDSDPCIKRLVYLKLLDKEIPYQESELTNQYTHLFNHEENGWTGI